MARADCTEKTRCPACRIGTRTCACKSEKEVLGFFVSGHPMDKYATRLAT